MFTQCSGCHFFFYLGFLSRTLTIQKDSRGKGAISLPLLFNSVPLINSSLPLPHPSQTLRHQPSNYCRVLPSAHNQQSDLSREPLVSKRKSLTTKLHAPKLNLGRVSTGISFATFETHKEKLQEQIKRVYKNRILRWSIDATAKTQRNTVNKELKVH